MAAVTYDTQTARQAYKREYYLKNRERILERNKQWVIDNFEKVKARKAIHNRHRVYRLSEERYQEMLKSQDNLCAICGVFMEKPHVDHSHKTKLVRGLLCDRCNRGLGYFKDNPINLKKASEYLIKEDTMSKILSSDIGKEV